MPSWDLDAIRAARRTVAPVEPFSVKLGGKDIRFLPKPPAQLITDALADITAAEENDATRVVIAIVNFLHSVVLPEDRGTFTDVMLSVDDPIDPEDVADLYVYVCSKYAETSKPAEPEPNRTSREELERILDRIPPRMGRGKIADV